MFRINSRRERFFWIILVAIIFFYIGNVVFHQCDMAGTFPAVGINISDKNPLATLFLKKSVETGLPAKDGEARVYRWKDGKWKRIPGFCSKGHRFNSAKLRTPFGSVKMYIHDIRKDVHVSGAILRSGMWEGHGVSTMLSILKRDARMGFLDLGSQLGTYSLVAAKMGRRVVAVDPLVENVLRLCRTVQEGNLTDRVTILFTALSDGYRTVSFKRYSGNIGGTHIQAVNSIKLDINDNYNANYITTVRLDDILPFVDTPKAFVKIDVESHEYEALREGRQLLKSKDIQGILMEWFQIRATPKGEKLKSFLTDLSFQAIDPNRRHLLSKNYKRWPNDILWVRK